MSLNRDDMLDEDGNVTINGTKIYPGGVVYKGGLSRDCKPQGKGKMTYPDGVVHEGQFRDGIPNGKGKLTFPDGFAYEGEFRDGMLKGRLTFPSGVVQVGEFHDFKTVNELVQGSDSDGHDHGDLYWINGKGKLTYQDGNVHEGEFRDGLLNGKGKITTPEGLLYEGEFRGGLLNGKGKMTTFGFVHEGEFRDGLLNGNGRMTDPRGYVYEGGFQNFEPSGKGKMTKSDGSVYEGYFLDGMLNGKGKHTDFNGATLFEGEFRNGMPFVDVVSQPKKTRRGHRGGKKKTTDALPTVPEPDTADCDASAHSNVGAAVSQLCDLADTHLTTGPSPHLDDELESSIGGQNTCIVCFSDEKTHMAAPCGHICVCGACASKLVQCPYCRTSAAMWVRARLV